MVTSEQKKKWYSFAEASGDEAIIAMIPDFKEALVDGGKALDKVKEHELALEQYKDVDLSKLKADSDFLEKHGGKDGVLGKVAKAEGWEEDKARMERENEANKQTLADYQKSGELKDSEIKLLGLKNATQGVFHENFNLPKVLLDSCVASGEVYYGEDGSPWVKTETGQKPLSGDGLTMLKEKYKDGVKKPAGSGEDLDSQNNDQNNNSGGQVKINPFGNN